MELFSICLLVKIIIYWTIYMNKHVAHISNYVKF